MGWNLENIKILPPIMQILWNVLSFLYAPEYSSIENEKILRDAKILKETRDETVDEMNGVHTSLKNIFQQMNRKHELQQTRYRGLSKFYFIFWSAQTLWHRITSKVCLTALSKVFDHWILSNIWRVYFSLLNRLPENILLNSPYNFLTLLSNKEID